MSSTYSSSLPLGDRIVGRVVIARGKEQSTYALFLALVARMLPLSMFTAGASLRLATVLYMGYDNVGAVRHLLHVQQETIRGTPMWIHATALMVVALSGTGGRERAFDSRDHARRLHDELLRIVHETEATSGNRIALITGFLACAYRAYHFTIPGNHENVMRAYRPMLTRARALVVSDHDDHHLLDTMATFGLPALKDQ